MAAMATTSLSSILPRLRPCKVQIWAGDTRRLILANARILPSTLHTPEDSKLGFGSKCDLAAAAYRPLPKCFSTGTRLSSTGVSTGEMETKGDVNADGEGHEDKWEVKMLFDGDCPLCMREVDMLRRRNEDYGSIKFVDIAAEDYSPENNMGIDFETVSASGVYGSQRCHITAKGVAGEKAV
eukprot:TRINITY_DN12704_c0_g2_i1.p1 TRINITY_DN12704_c0_g2~~TRINITY_DN12704_c0_g2_i1.p1  ORF type:complete len:182 (+),score=23.55 TRINITY_DN12704_c0_g2_i1:94-639(+)